MQQGTRGSGAENAGPHKIRLAKKLSKGHKQACRCPIALIGRSRPTSFQPLRNVSQKKPDRLFFQAFPLFSNIPKIMQKPIQILMALFLAVFFFPASSRAESDPMQGPWEAPKIAAHGNSSGAGFDFTLGIYQSLVSPGSGHRCPMEPSCSTYARQSFATNGPFYGWILTADRLLRCGRDELHRARRVMKGGRILFPDPVRDNDLTLGTPPDRPDGIASAEK